MKDALEHIVVEELTPLGFDLVELRRGGSRARPVIDVRIDRRDEQPVTIDDCSRVSRVLERRLDADDALAGQHYVLEVSSPGAERRLNGAKDWRRFVGRKAYVKSAALGGRREVDIVGVDDGGEDGEGGEVITLRDANGDLHQLRLRDIAEARLAFHWD
jgi:ribosome maturation factor RimP